MSSSSVMVVLWQPYVPAYDNVPEGLYRIPDWISETIYTRNTVTVLPRARDQVRGLVSQLRMYRDDVVAPISRAARKAMRKGEMSETSLFQEEEFWKGKAPLN